MDCRSWLSALGMIFGSVGCVQTGMPIAANGEWTRPAEAEREPGRQPRPTTCVAFGNFTERAAADPSRSPLEQERFRDQARRSYQQALQIDPNNLVALTALARLYTTIDDHGRAVATYQRGIQSHPNEASLCYELGMCHAREKEWDPALLSLRRAVTIDPENRQYSRALGFCLARAGYYDESLRTFISVEGEAQAHYDLARMLHHLHQDELSKQHVQIALARKPQLPGAQQLLTSLESPTSASGKTPTLPVIDVGTAYKKVEAASPDKDKTQSPFVVELR